MGRTHFEFAQDRPRTVTINAIFCLMPFLRYDRHLIADFDRDRNRLFYG